MNQLSNIFYILPSILIVTGYNTESHIPFLHKHTPTPYFSYIKSKLTCCGLNVNSVCKGSEYTVCYFVGWTCSNNWQMYHATDTAVTTHLNTFSLLSRMPCFFPFVGCYPPPCCSVCTAPFVQVSAVKATLVGPLSWSLLLLGSPLR